MISETPQILLVEQEQSVIDHVTSMIEKIGFNKPQIAFSGEEAKNLVLKNKPDLALVDMSLNNMEDGRNTARMLYEDYNLPVIYLAAREDGTDKQESSTSYGYVLKPVDHRNLKKTIMLAISRHSLLDNFAALITQLTVPAVFIDAISMEILTCNDSFTTSFPEIQKHTRLGELQKCDIGTISTLTGIVTRVKQVTKPVITEVTLSTAVGLKSYNIFARPIESMGQSAVTITFVEIEPAVDETFDCSPMMQLRIDTKGTILAANRQWLDKTGYANEDVINKPVTSIFPETSVRHLADEILPGLASGRTMNMEELDVRLQGGGISHYHVFFSFLPKSSNFLIAFVDASFVSIIQKEQEENILANALRDSAAALTSTLNFDEVLDRILVNVGEVVPNEAANVMMIWSGVAYIVRSTGYAERGIEESMMSLQIPITQESHFLSMYTTGMPLAVGDIREYAALESVSDIHWARSMASAPLRSKGQVFGFLNLESSQPGFYNQHHADRLQAFADQAAVAIENARLYAEVQQYAITDELTDIYNRRGLFELGRREVERAHRYGRSLSAVMIDTDKFKEINDNYSHAVGDHVLRVLADRWKASIREVDILGRYGGDEFVILLPETDLENAMPVADRLRVAICNKPIETPIAELLLTVSVGVATLTDSIKTFDELIEKADEAMFRSKAEGRNKTNR
jgi:diguanylate cyclase (GGDEF)-like protein/PAS domain S-box-containing protein